MNCPKCGNPLEENEEFCRKCYEIVPHRSWWERLLLSLANRWRGAGGAPSANKMFTLKQTFKTSEKVYHSLDEMPPELRAMVEKAKAEALQSGKSVDQTFTYKDSSGITKTYHSLDEMPPEVRVMFDRIQRDSG